MTVVNNTLNHILFANQAHAKLAPNLFQARWVYEASICKAGTYKISREPSVGDRRIEDDTGKSLEQSSVSIAGLVEY